MFKSYFLRQGFSFIFVLSQLLPGFALAQGACFGLFEKSALATSASQPISADPFSRLLRSLQVGDPNAIKVVNDTVLEIARRPELHLEIPRYSEQLLYLSAQVVNGQLKASFTLRLAEQANHLLRLINDKELVFWKAILTQDRALVAMNEFGNYGTMGHMLRLLPENKKTELLAYLGSIYAVEKNRALLQPVHVLLDPKSIYDQFKARGLSDRDFYSYYLQLIKNRLFPNAPVGGYGGEKVIQIAELVQKYVINDSFRAVNFFGSVPNGFGKKNSDLDIFNSPVGMKELTGENYVDFARSFDLFDHHRHQIVDPYFQRAVDILLKETPWKWRSEDHGDRPSEHFSGERHVFTFHITKEKIVLRFYYHKLKWDEQANTVIWDYLELDMSHF